MDEVQFDLVFCFKFGTEKVVIGYWFELIGATSDADRSLHELPWSL